MATINVDCSDFLEFQVFSYIKVKPILYLHSHIWYYMVTINIYQFNRI